MSKPMISLKRLRYITSVKKRFNITKFKDYKYDLAILVDPDETYPPSNKVALSKFKVAADKLGFYTEFIAKDDYHRIAEFDALFIKVIYDSIEYARNIKRNVVNKKPTMTVGFCLKKNKKKLSFDN